MGTWNELVPLGVSSDEYINNAMKTHEEWEFVVMKSSGKWWSRNEMIRPQFGTRIYG